MAILNTSRFAHPQILYNLHLIIYFPCILLIESLNIKLPQKFKCLKLVYKQNIIKIFYLQIKQHSSIFQFYIIFGFSSKVHATGSTGCSTWIVTFLISNFDTVNIILSIWEFNQFLYMLLGVLSQNFIGMGWKMHDLRMSILTLVG